MKYIVDRFVKHDELPNYTDIPKHYIFENTIFRNFVHGYLVPLINTRQFCKTGAKPNMPVLNHIDCSTCPYHEICKDSYNKFW